jgi:hypothetical protein
VSFVRRCSLAALLVLVTAVVALAACRPADVEARSRSQAAYLKAANHGVKQTRKWWSRGRHWYSSVLHGPDVVSLWGVVPLFEALGGLQIAQPSNRHRRALNRFARRAKRYLNPALLPVPGFGPKPGQHDAGKTAWFDDNGWWGMAFLDAYRATGNPDYLIQAQIAQNFISISGWDTTPGRPGGIWWNTNRSFYAGESLAGGTLLSARLYALTHEQHYLDDALKFIAWGDAWLTDPATGLYARLRKPGTYGVQASAAAQAAEADRRDAARYPDQAAKLSAARPEAGARIAKRNYPPFASVPMPYVNGPMILAHQIICEETGRRHYCDRARQLAGITLAVYRRFWMGPQYDFWYVRTMLEFAQRDDSGDWYGIAQRSARSALHRAHVKRGLYLRTWYGKSAHKAGAPSTSLQLHSANAALFAWMAALGR